ncbi:MAG: cupin domain-containing protein [Burkholderiales bacterium]|nr:cupin domain-containing protein [Burkholderiales bacterium]
MALPTFEEFSAAVRSKGFDQVLVREWQAGHATPEHDHPFDVSALVVRGEFWLTVDGAVRHLRAGDTFEVARGTRHTERYGPEGATFWVGRAS